MPGLEEDAESRYFLYCVSDFVKSVGDESVTGAPFPVKVRNPLFRYWTISYSLPKFSFNLPMTE